MRTTPSPPAVKHALWTALLLTVTALAGCAHESGDDDGDGSGTVGLAFAEHEELGSILVDGDGMTLYIFENDEPGTSNCFDQCAENWPPLLADEVQGPEGLTLIDRDGEQQVAHDERPLYYFVGDEEPGDANGEGLNDVWFVVRESET